MAEKKKAKTEPNKAIHAKVKMEWQVPDSLESVYANQMIVEGLEFENVISFFETRPPLLVANTQEELQQMVSSVSSIPARCVARVVVAKERMHAFIKAFMTHAQRIADSETIDNKESHKTNGELKGDKT